MSRTVFDRLAIVVGTVSGAIFCVVMTNSLVPILAIAIVVHLTIMHQRTDNGDALRKAQGQAGAQRRTRRRDDE